MTSDSKDFVQWLLEREKSVARERDIADAMKREADFERLLRRDLLAEAAAQSSAIDAHLRSQDEVALFLQSHFITAEDARRLEVAGGLPVSKQLDQWISLQYRIDQFEHADRLNQLRETAATAWLANSVSMSAHVVQLQKVAVGLNDPRRFLYPALGFGAYARASVERLALSEVDSPDLAASVSASIPLAARQLEGGTALIEAALAGSTPTIERKADKRHISDPAGVISPARTGDQAATSVVAPAAGVGAVFEVQEAELVAASVHSDADEETLLRSSATACVLSSAQKLGSLVIAVNRAQELHLRPAVFPMTTAMADALMTICYHTVVDATSLGVAVDALYVLLYEGSGDMERVLNHIPEAACAGVWSLKSLRNHWLRHDPAHGSASKQAKKQQALRDTLQSHGLVTYPRDPSEYAVLYERLLQSLYRTLDELLRALTRRG